MAFDISHGFAPLGCENPSVLVLGTLPSVQSLARGEYYAHPRNAFWSIIECLSGEKFAGDYNRKVLSVSRLGIALWDVYQGAERKGSLDSNIVVSSASVNDFSGLLQSASSLQLIACNGGAAHDAFLKHTDLEVFSSCGVRVAKLPSTSPAYAAMSLEEKQARWINALKPHLRCEASQ